MFFDFSFGFRKKNDLTADHAIRQWGIWSLILSGLLTIPTWRDFFVSAQTGQSMHDLLYITWRQMAFTFVPHHPLISQSLIYGIILLLAFVYLRALLQLSTAIKQGHHLSIRSLLLWFSLVGLVQICIIPIHSLDIYDYINYSAVQAFLGLNPGSVIIQNHLSHPFFQPASTHWPGIYGFFFYFLGKNLCLLSQGNYLLCFLLFKGMFFSMYMGCVWIIFSIVKALKSVSHPCMAAFFFGAHPLVLLNTLADGHNDIVMAFFLLAALGALFTQRFKWLSWTLWLGSVGIKYTTLMIFPVLFIDQLKTVKKRTLIIGFLLMAWVMMVAVIPYYSAYTPSSIASIKENIAGHHGSLAALLKNILLLFEPFRTIWRPWIKPILSGFTSLSWVIYILFLLKISWNLLRNKSIALPPKSSLESSKELTENASHDTNTEARYASVQTMNPMIQSIIMPTTLLLTVLQVFVAAKFYMWYLTLVIALAALCPSEWRFRRFILLMSFLGILGLTLLGDIPILNVSFMILFPFWIVYGNQEKILPTCIIQLLDS